MRHVLCSKVAYESKAAAKVAKRSCRERAASEGQLSRRHEQRIYRCPSCGAWHLTSKPHWRYGSEAA